MTRSPVRWDVRLNRSNCLAAVVLCLVASAALGWRAGGRRWFGRAVPIWPDRLAEVVERIDPNTASAASLQRLRGIGRVKAEAIVAYRRAHGGRPFARAEDLTAVRGIGNGIVRRIHTHLTLPPSVERR